MEVEGIFEKLHLYAYENWEKGEIIQGPDISKYWIEVILMYPSSIAPNRAGVKRLEKHGCHVFFKEDTMTDNVKIKSSDDLISSDVRKSKMVPKTVEIPVCIVKIVIPRHLLTDYNIRKTAGQSEVSYDDVIAAYDEGLDVERSDSAGDDTTDNEEDFTDEEIS